MSYHPFTNVLEYIPARYVGLTSKQQQDRQAVYDFKNGSCPIYARDLLSSKIASIIASTPSSWVVCFIPASTKSKHIKRYCNLASYLGKVLACPVCIDGIDVAYDRESGHVSGKSGNPIENMIFNPERFSGKKVVLIDDVRTRGVTFDRTADKLVSLGAVSVYGVFLAQTIHPNLPIDTTPKYHGGYYDEIMNDYLAEEEYQQELANEIMAEEQYQQELADEIMADEYYQHELEEELMCDYLDIEEYY